MSLTRAERVLKLAETLTPEQVRLLREAVDCFVGPMERSPELTEEEWDEVDAEKEIDDRALGRLALLVEALLVEVRR